MATFTTLSADDDFYTPLSAEAMHMAEKMAQGLLLGFEIDLDRWRAGEDIECQHTSEPDGGGYVWRGNTAQFSEAELLAAKHRAEYWIDRP